MDRDTAVARIQQKTGFRTDRVTEIRAALQDAQDQLERGTTLPPWLWSEDTAFTLTPASPISVNPLEVALPTNFIRESDEREGNLYFRLTNSVQPIFITKMDFREAEEFFFSRRKSWWNGTVETIQSQDPAPQPGAPMVYVLRQNTARFYPGPDQVYNLKWTYYKHDSALTGQNVGDGTIYPNGWLTNAPWLLIGEAMLLFATDIRDGDAIEAANLLLNGDPRVKTRGARADYLATIYERQIAGRNFRMGARL